MFRNVAAAREHFGSDEYEGFEIPGCIDPLRRDEKARLKELRDAQKYAMECRKQADENSEAAEMLESFRTELERYFGKGATRPWVAWDRYVSLRNELNDLKGKVIP